MIASIHSKSQKSRWATLALMALSLLAACGSPTPVPLPDPPPLAEQLIFYDWEDATPQSVLDAFTEEYGVQVNYVNYDSQDHAVENLVAGEVYDVVVIENQLIPTLAEAGLLAEIDHQNVPNIKNISANFRDLAYDPGNRVSVPYSWGTTGLIVRSDLVEQPISRWADLWDSRYAGKIGLYSNDPRTVIALTLKSLGYSINSEDPDELEEALAHLLELNSIVFTDEFSSAPLLVSGQAVVSLAYADDGWIGREENEAISYVLPEEGALLWGDNFVIPANSPNKYTAELFLNFLLRPEISAQIVNEYYYTSPNEAAQTMIAPEILNDHLIFPPNEDLINAEILLPLSPEGEILYAEIWERFMADVDS